MGFLDLVCFSLGKLFNPRLPRLRNKSSRGYPVNLQLEERMVYFSMEEQEIFIPCAWCGKESFTYRNGVWLCGDCVSDLAKHIQDESDESLYLEGSITNVTTAASGKRPSCLIIVVVAMGIVIGVGAAVVMLLGIV